MTARRKSRVKRQTKKVISTKRAFRHKLINALNKLQGISSSRRVEEVVRAPKKFIHDISNALGACRKCKVKLPTDLIRKVKKNAKALRKLSNPRVSVTTKKKTIQQHGDGLIETIANPIPTVGHVISNLFGL